MIPFAYKIRPATKDSDLSFVYGAWLESYKKDAKPGTWLFCVKWGRYRSLQTKAIRGILDTGKTLVATLEDDEDHIIGFVSGSCVEEEGVLHYVYVRPSRRRVGLAKELVTQLDKTLTNKLQEYTHQTKAGQDFIKNYSYTYNPLAR